MTVGKLGGKRGEGGDEEGRAVNLEVWVGVRWVGGCMERLRYGV